MILWGVAGLIGTVGAVSWVLAEGRRLMKQTSFALFLTSLILVAIAEFNRF